MYVCVCKAVTDRQIMEAINEGASTCRQLFKSTGACSVCGKCSHHLKQILDENRQETPIMKAA